MPYSTEKKARVLVDAALSTDRAAAEDHNVSRSSVKRWRSDLETDEDLRARFDELWQKVEEAEAWTERATSSIREALRFLDAAMDRLDPSDPEAVAAVTDAIETLADATMMQDIVSARLEKKKAPGDVRATHRKN